MQWIVFVIFNFMHHSSKFPPRRCIQIHVITLFTQSEASNLMAFPFYILTSKCWVVNDVKLKSKKDRAHVLTLMMPKRTTVCTLGKLGFWLPTWQTCITPAPILAALVRVCMPKEEYIFKSCYEGKDSGKAMWVLKFTSWLGNFMGSTGTMRTRCSSLFWILFSLGCLQDIAPKIGVQWGERSNLLQFKNSLSANETFSLQKSVLIRHCFHGLAWR